MGKDHQRFQSMIDEWRAEIKKLQAEDITLGTQAKFIRQRRVRIRAIISKHRANIKKMKATIMSRVPKPPKPSLETTILIQLQKKYGLSSACTRAELASIRRLYAKDHHPDVIGPTGHEQMAIANAIIDRMVT